MAKTVKDQNSKRTKLSQSEFPRYSLERTLVITEAIWNNFAGKGGAPHDIALSLDKAPTSGDWRNLCGSSIAYGLTEGGYNANEIILSELGKRIVAPEQEGDDMLGKVQSILQPRIMKEFFEKYDKAKFPTEVIAKNVLIGFGLPKERANFAYNILIENGKYTGILRDSKTGLFVSLGSPKPLLVQEPNDVDGTAEEIEEETAQKIVDLGSKDFASQKTTPPLENNKVYISHGKNRKIVDQLKELLTFGKFEPIVSVDRETTSIPVPEKVFEDMRKCAAAVIHLKSEGEYMDPEGNKHIKINENVLIEIGAAIALFDKKFVLLVEKALQLPSNLQGLYRCDYVGEILDYEATMKLLKIFNEFRKK